MSSADSPTPRARRSRPASPGRGSTTATSSPTPTSGCGTRTTEVLAYLEAENAYTEARTAHLDRAGRGPVRRDQGADPGDRPQRPELRRARRRLGLLVLRPYGRGLGVPDLLPRGGSRPTPAARPRRPRSRARRSCWTPTSPRPGTSSSPSARSRVSPDGHLLAYSVDVIGDERFTLRIRDLTTGEDLTDQIDDIAYGVAWAGNDARLLHPRRPGLAAVHGPPAPPRQPTPAADVEVFTEPDERFWVGVGASRDRRWVVIGASSKLTSECRLLSTADPEGEPRVVAQRRQGVEYDVEPAGDRLLIVHNDGAEDFALAEAPLDATSHAGLAAGAARPARRPGAGRGRVRQPCRGGGAPRRADRAAPAAPRRRTAASVAAPTSPSTSRSTWWRRPARRSTTPRRSGSATPRC